MFKHFIQLGKFIVKNFIPSNYRVQKFVIVISDDNLQFEENRLNFAF